MSAEGSRSAEWEQSQINSGKSSRASAQADIDEVRKRLQERQQGQHTERKVEPEQNCKRVN